MQRALRVICSRKAWVGLVLLWSQTSFADELNVFDDPAQKNRLSLGLTYANGGRAKADFQLFEVTSDMDSSIGLNADFLVVLNTYLMVGARLGLQSIEIQRSERPLGNMVWVGLVPRLRLPLSKSAELAISPVIGYGGSAFVWNPSLGPAFYLGEKAMLSLELSYISATIGDSNIAEWSYSMFSFGVSLSFLL